LSEQKFLFAKYSITKKCIVKILLTSNIFEMLYFNREIPEAFTELSSQETYWIFCVPNIFAFYPDCNAKLGVFLDKP